MARYTRRSDVEQRATTIELFYDLVFVFAITQISHLLLHRLTWGALAEAGLALLVVWWAWNYTTWVTNELDPEAPAVRLLLLAIMLAALLLATAIPEAFGNHGLLFAGAYVAIQVGRHGFLTFVTADRGTVARERGLAILLWFSFAGVFWIAGGIADDGVRAALWGVAITIDYAAPLVVFRVPGRRQLDPQAWEIETSHFAERFQLFIIIALGESIVVTGATTSALGLDAGRVAALTVAFLGTAAFWWLHFNLSARAAERHLEHARERTELARDAYTYLHVVFVAGILLAAVGDAIVIADPSSELDRGETLVLVAGPAIYLLAHVLFRLRVAGGVSRTRSVGALACLAVAPLAAVLPALAVATALLGVLLGVIAGDVRGHRRVVARAAAAEG